ncbi:hypothetical protein AUJ84_01570 [Candidatus Pacearchaeota archaeon CG1_02_32_132]|nr:MAG: hypothetical protein AUJ84_01570 [Candidatus Pacearchaeota archaeon CG1_02_32_132]
MKKLRILAAADLHGDSKLTKRLAKRAEDENVDLVVLCGDLTGFTDSKGLIKPFKDKGQKVLILPGNWDSFATVDFLAQIYGVRNIHGYSAQYEGVGFFGAGGATNIGPRSTVSEKEIMETLDKAHKGLKGIERKVMLTHMHPAGSKSEFSGIEGSEAIRRAIKKFKPDFLLHGHIHEASGMEETIYGTRVINVGKKGTILEI